MKWSENHSFKACRLIFKRNFISKLSTEGHLFGKKKKQHSKGTGPFDKANYSNSNGSSTVTLYSNDNDN